MLEINYIHQNKDLVIQKLKTRQVHHAADLVEAVVEKDQLRKKTQTDFDAAAAKLNQLSKQAAELAKTGDMAAVESLRATTQTLKSQVKALGHQLKQYEADLATALCELPNLPHDDVPIGHQDKDDVIIEQPDELPPVKGKKLPHWELAATYHIIDFGLGNKITGAGFPVYKNKGAQLQRALINFCLDEARKAGYEEVQPPILVNQASAYATGQLPDKAGQMYQLTEDGLYLIPTAEVPVTNLYRDEIIPIEALPIKNVAYTPCFRREAGSWGSHVRGLNRLHQFDKVELVEISHPDESYSALMRMRQYVCTLLDKLELPYRILKLCSGSLGFTAALTYDIEVFAGGQERWLEVSSISNFESYQANRLQLRYKDQNKMRLLHTLNGSALPLPRIVAALLENNQTDNGIIIPDALQSYTGFDAIH